MRLATFNVLHGASPVDGRVDLGRFAAAVAGLDVDVLALQEVDRHQQRSAHADLTAVAAEAMGASAFRFAPVLSGLPGTTWVGAREDDPPGHPAYGIALLSRYPVTAWRVLPLRRLPVPMPWPSPDRRRLTRIRDEPRLVLAADLGTPFGPLTVACSHLSFLVGWASVQLAQTARWLAPTPGPVVLMGDLNLLGRAPERITGFRALARHRTFPASRPTRQIDHILLRGELGRVTGSSAPAVDLSDHRPLVVDLDADRRTVSGV